MYMPRAIAQKRGLVKETEAKGGMLKDRVRYNASRSSFEYFNLGVLSLFSVKESYISYQMHARRKQVGERSDFHCTFFSCV
jgi:hypothetical protein